MGVELAPVKGSITMDGSSGVAAFGMNIKSAKEFQKEAETAMKGVTSAVKREANEAGNSLKSKLEGLKESLGRRSVFGESIELLSGGAVIAGLGLAAEKVKAFGESIKDLSDNWGEYSHDQEKGMEKLVSLIPILGDVITGIHDVQLAIQGQNDAVKFSQEEWKKYGEIITKVQGILKDGVDGKIAGLNASRQNSEDAMRLLKYPEGAKRDIEGVLINQQHSDFSNENNAKAQIASLGIDKYQKMVEDEDKTGNSIYGHHVQLDKLTAQRDAINSKLAEAEKASALLASAQISDIKAKAAQKDADNEIDKQLEATQKWIEGFNARREVLDGLKKDLDQIGMTDIQKKLDDLDHSKIFIGNPEGLKAAKNIAQSIDVKTLEKSLETPTQKLKEMTDHYAALFASGQLSLPEFNQLTLKARNETVGQPSQSLPGLYVHGSAEAQAARYDGGRKKADGVKESTDKVVENTSRTNDLMQQNVAAVQAMQWPTPAQL